MPERDWNRREDPPELFWDLKRVLIATAVFAIFGFFSGWVVYYAMTLGFNVTHKKAESWLYGVPLGATLFAFLATLFFAKTERRRLLDHYRRED